MIVSIKETGRRGPEAAVSSNACGLDQNCAFPPSVNSQAAAHYPGSIKQIKLNLSDPHLLSPPLSSSTTDVSVTSIISLTFVLCVKALLNSFVEQFRCVHVLVTLFGVSRPKLTNSNVTLYYVFPVTFGFFLRTLCCLCEYYDAFTASTPNLHHHIDVSFSVKVLSRLTFQVPSASTSNPLLHTQGRARAHAHAPPHVRTLIFFYFLLWLH